ncbi:deoxyribose-phosphate aldolase [Chelonus insularis]|uniref:deoxyribose-phosphate aldolase n=1 Tax=Chelonus insularis TaxID=460826 RepID=UPI001589AEDA|nr:deoxyribose-phosphate aldolase [Chelonus insularis]
MGAQTKILVLLGLNNSINIDEVAINEKIKQIRSRVNTMEDKEKLILLQKAITFLDLTSLNTDDTQEVIQTLCLKAMKPIESQDKTKECLHTAAVCVYPDRAQDAIDILIDHVGRFISVASVAGDFPSGKRPFEERLQEVVDVVKLGVDEVDVVIDRSLVLTHDWDELFNQLSSMKDACDAKHMKTILSVGDLPSLNHIYKVSMVAMAAGSDFIKTSTGKEVVNANLPAGMVMCQAIREYKKITGRKVGLKPAGGIKTAVQALEWLILVKEELGEEWLNKTFFRIGASSLLDDIVATIHDLSK